MLKVFRRAVAALFLATILFVNAVSHAEVKTYVGEGSYCMSEGENLGVAKERAKADAMRNACEKAGVYVKSYSRARNFELDEDVIETMTANILKLVEDPHFYPLETVDNLEGVLIRVTVNAQIDDSDITRWLNKDDNEKSMLVSQMEALRNAYDEQSRQVEELKRQLANNPQDIKQITKKFEAEDKVFLSNQKVDRAWKLYDKGDYEGAIKFHNEALQLNPNNSNAYFGRGTSYSAGLQQYKQAIQDYDKAIELNPNDDYAYNNRGACYSKLGQNERAIQDFDKAIELNPNNSKAFYNLGNAYSDLGQYEQAIQNYDKAIELNPNYASAYNNRGACYNELGQNERAIQDFNKIIELNPSYALAYNNRGNAYIGLKQYERAIQDFDKAIELNPKYADAYNNRGEAYYYLKNYEKAFADLNKAIELGISGKNLGEALYYRGLCYQATGNKSKAQADFAKAKELGYTE